MLQEINFKTTGIKMAVSNSLMLRTEINTPPETPQEAKAKDYPHNVLPPELFSEFIRYLKPEEAVNYAKSLTNRASQSEKGNLFAVNLFKENLRGVTNLTLDDPKRCKASYQDLTGEKISNKDFLGFFKNLKILSLDDELATPEVLTILKDFPHLTNLDLLRCEQIEDFSFLGSLVKLTVLYLKECRQVEDFSFLKNLTNLTVLYLEECRQVEDFSFLENLTNLTILYFGNCTQIIDFSFLGSLVKLTALYLGECSQEEDFSFLESLTSLTTLSLNGCTQIEDFSFLESLKHLTTLYLAWCTQIEDFSFLERLPNLTTLNLSGCVQITDRSIFDVYPNIDIEWL